MPLINVVVRNKCKKDYRSSNATYAAAKRKQFQYLKFMFSLFHVHVSLFPGTLRTNIMWFASKSILGDPGADKGGEGKSKRAEKYTFLRAIFSARLDFPSSQLSAPGSPRMRQISLTIKTPTPSPTVYFGTNYKMSTMSARSWRSYGKIEDYEQFIGIRLNAAVFLAPAIS